MAEVLSTPWLPPYGQNGELNYVPRPMLEPIIEETTDDEADAVTTTADNSWSQYESAWSSESETGSVIRVGGLSLGINNNHIQLLFPYFHLTFVQIKIHCRNESSRVHQSGESNKNSSKRKLFS